MASRLIVWLCVRLLCSWQIDLSGGEKKNKKTTLTAELSIRWPVKAVCLVYTRRRGTLVDKAKPAVSESLELLDPLLWTAVADVFVLITRALGRAAACV